MQILSIYNVCSRHKGITLRVEKLYNENMIDELFSNFTEAGILKISE
jgi:hypothetical protein